MQNINDLLKKYKQNPKNSQAQGKGSGDDSSNVKTSSKKNNDDDVVGQQFQEKMRDIEIKQKEQQAMARAQELGIRHMSLFRFPIAPEVLTLIKKDQAKQVGAICFYYRDKQMKIGGLDPNQESFEDLVANMQERFNCDIEVFVISQYSFDMAYKLYATVPEFRKIERGVKISEEKLDEFKNEITNFDQLQEKITQVNISDIITLVLAAGLKMDASDVHIEAEEKGINVRFRVDGVLHDVAIIEKELWPKVISRLKLLAGLKINVSNKPQDGRFTITLSKDQIDMRVSALPTNWGESVVMRILKPTAIQLGFEELGISGATFDRLKHEILRPNGMIITTGPTGSGKTTTLYAVLNKLNTEESKIITLEDPIEYKLKRINQSQVDRQKGYTFASGLKSILRQDPDVVMVGELRDYETADVAINAALTGHLVVSTIHTNSAAGAVPRFLAMDIKPFLLAPALNAIIGQRLVRRICKHCKVETELASDSMERVLKYLDEISPLAGINIDKEKLKFYKGEGCEECNGIGYKGRIGIYEVLIMNKQIEDLILSGKVSEYDMQSVGVENGMVTMVQDGILKASEGVTTIAEVFRVIE